MLKIAKSEELFQLLKERIGTMNNGDRFHSVRQLMKEFEVSQFSIKPALDKLEEEGLINCIVGKGTFVRRPQQAAVKKILMLVPEWPSPAIREMVEKMEKAVTARSHQFKKCFYDCREDVYAQLREFQADAIVLDPINPGDLSPSNLHNLLKCPCPVVLIRSIASNARINYVCGNNTAAGMIAAQYLLEQGHRRLALAITEPKVRTSRDLADSFTHYVRAHGAHLQIIDCHTVSGEDAGMKAYLKTTEWLQCHKVDFTAMFVVSDDTVIGCQKALAEKNIRIPDDVSIIGFGNVASSALYHPALTTIDTDRDKMSAATVDIIEKCIADPASAGYQVNVYPEIVIRDSVKNININP